MGDLPADLLWIVTGASGFLGNTLVRALLERQQRVRACIAEPELPASLAGLDCEITRLDLTDLASVAAAFAHSSATPAFVVHCAGIVSTAAKASPMLHRVNVDGTASVIVACRSAGVNRMAFISSVHAIPEPNPPGTIVEIDDPAGFDPDLVVGPYARSKARATALVLEATDLWRVVIHPSGLIGPYDFGDTYMTRMVRDAATGKLPAVVDGGYDFVDVRDVAAGIISALTCGTPGRCYILSGGYFEVAKLVHDVCLLTGQRPPIKVPLWLAKACAPAAELAARRRNVKPLFTGYALRTLNSPSEFSHQRATTELGYGTRPMSQTLADTVAWLQAKTEHELGVPSA
ncbi:MAG: NAD-dependent epimerase/dehydratase family protein [Acidobacteriota bacterium]|nr:NAD-dependent epimerase/dehydratase family protein [Acidobacteriota bacterium]NLH70211.1 NAD-dependent epimerase/dehydratase family protein [Brooklawnia sp.]